MNKQEIIELKVAELEDWPSYNHVTQEHRDLAADYLEAYEGGFTFLDSMKSYMSKSGREGLTPNQITAVLKCAKRNGKKLLEEASETPKPVTGPEEVSKVIPNLSLTDEEVEEKFADISVALEAAVNPEIKAAQDLLAEADKEIKEYDKEEEKLDKEEEKLDLKREELYKKLREIDIQVSEVKKKKREVDYRKYDLTRKRTELVKSLDEKMQEAMSRKKIEEFQSKFEEMRKSQPWNEACMDYQWEDISYLGASFMEGKSGVLVANDMGTGKTFTAAAFDSLVKDLFFEKFGRYPTTLWLTKKNLKKTTVQEIIRWNPDKTIIMVEGTPAEREFQIAFARQANAMVIANYETMNNTPSLMSNEWDIIYMDEVHKLKGGANPSGPSKVFENARRITKNAKFLVPLSGSPMQNHPREMWCYLHLFDPEYFKKVRDFEAMFCGGFGIPGVSWDRLVQVALKGRVIRRKKEDVLKDLPDKTRVFRYIELSPYQRILYNELRDKFFIWLDGQDEPMTIDAIIAQLTYLREMVLLPSAIEGISSNESAKFDEAIELIEELTNAGEQVVVYSAQFTKPLFHLADRIRQELHLPVETLTGVNSDKADEVQTRFQNAETKVLLSNLKVGGEGINLQKNPGVWEGGASNAIFLDRWYNPELNRQGEDRLHRKGQKDAVTIHIFHAEDTVDAFVADIIQKKEEAIEGVMERQELRSASEWKKVLANLI